MNTDYISTCCGTVPIENTLEHDGNGKHFGICSRCKDGTEFEWVPDIAEDEHLDAMLEQQELEDFAGDADMSQWEMNY